MTIKLTSLLTKNDQITVVEKYSITCYRKDLILSDGSKIINPEFKKYFEFINYNNIYL